MLNISDDALALFHLSNEEQSLRLEMAVIDAEAEAIKRDVSVLLRLLDEKQSRMSLLNLKIKAIEDAQANIIIRDRLTNIQKLYRTMS